MYVYSLSITRARIGLTYTGGAGDGQFALRWRTEEEVLSSIGEETCGNTRCVHHEPSKALASPPLKTVELPFAYEESGEQKAALVKVVLCGKCLKKLMWKREREKELQRDALAKTETQTGVPQPEDIIQEAMGLNKPLEDDADDRHKDNAQQGYKMRRGEAQTISRRRRSSRSHSPGLRNEKKGKRRRSPS